MSPTGRDAWPRSSTATGSAPTPSARPWPVTSRVRTTWVSISTTATNTSRRMLGAYKARVAPFNVNYRYVEEELRYLLRDSKAAGSSTTPTFAPILEGILPELRDLELLIQVADELGPGPPARCRRLRTGPRLSTPRAAPGEPLPRRPVHPLHGRDHGHAEGCPVAPARHLPGGHGWADLRDLGAGRKFRAPHQPDPSRRRGPGHVHPSPHARSGPVGQLLLHDHGRHPGLPHQHPHSRPGRRVEDGGAGAHHRPLGRRRRHGPPSGRRARTRRPTTPPASWPSAAAAPC